MDSRLRGNDGNKAAATTAAPEHRAASNSGVGGAFRITGLLAVIPAKAGIHPSEYHALRKADRRVQMDSRLRGNDGNKAAATSASPEHRAASNSGVGGAFRITGLLAVIPAKAGIHPSAYHALRKAESSCPDGFPPARE
jgi:hypothetical protein